MVLLEVVFNVVLDAKCESCRAEAAVRRAMKTNRTFSPLGFILNKILFMIMR